MSRRLYIVAYDITEGDRLTAVRDLLKGYSTGGQKSVYECFLTDAELNQVIHGVKGVIDPESDRVHIFTMDARSRTHTLGIGVQPKDPAFFYFG